MTDAETILVVFLSTALAVFLVLGIVLLAFLIDIAQRIRRITIKAEHLADKAEAAAEFMQKAAVPLALNKLVSAVKELFHKKSEKE